MSRLDITKPSTNMATLAKLISGSHGSIDGRVVHCDIDITRSQAQAKAYAEMPVSDVPVVGSEVKP